MSRTLRVTVLAALLLFGLPSNLPLAQAAPAGSIDPTFGSGGMTSLTDAQGLGFRAALMLPDGSTVVATSNGLSGPEAVVMVKVGPDGKVDSSFQEDGFAAASVYYAYLHALALAPDGKIVGVGQAAIEGGGQAWLIARFD